jgi:hypothetical protein
VYTTRDGVPRYRFGTPPTTEVRKIVTVTSLLPGSVERTGGRLPACDFSNNAEFCGILWKTYITNVTANGFTEDERYIPGPGGWRQRCKKPKQCLLETGEEVLLIYWPAPETLGSKDRFFFNDSRHAIPVVVTTSAITFAGQDLYLRDTIDSSGKVVGHEIQICPEAGCLRFQKGYITASVLQGPFTFTSPTVYLAHHAITLQKSVYATGVWGTAWDQPEKSKSIIRTAGIIPLSTTEVYSIRPLGSEERRKNSYANRVAKGQYYTDKKDIWYPSMYGGDPYHLTRTEHVPFDFENLANPMPASVYYDARDDCWGHQTHCGTITNDTYRPRLAIKNRVWSSLFPEYWECDRPLLLTLPWLLVT